MLIFVQVYKTIDKREQKNQQKGSLKCLKKSAPEVMTSSEASSSEATSPEARSPEAEVHQLLVRLLLMNKHPMPSNFISRAVAILFQSFAMPRRD